MMSVYCKTCSEEMFLKETRPDCPKCGSSIELVHISESQEASSQLTRFARLDRAIAMAGAELGRAKLVLADTQDEYSRARIQLNIDAVLYSLKILNDARFIEEVIEELIEEFTDAPEAVH